MIDPLSPIYSELWDVANSQICTISSSYPETHEFGTAIAQNISDLEGQP